MDGWFITFMEMLNKDIPNEGREYSPPPITIHIRDTQGYIHQEKVILDNE